MFALPCLPPHVSSDSPFPSQQTPSALGRVLLIDDEWESHDIVRRTLNAFGCPLYYDSAFGGEEGIEFLDRYRSGLRPWPCLVFIDIKMPGANGFDVLEWANAHQVLGKSVFVMLSSSTEPGDVVKSFQLGVHHYVSKSSPPEVLRDLVLNARRFVRPPMPTGNLDLSLHPLV